jgi:hypothetical protein
MPECQFPIFCSFCVSEKLHRKYSQNWTKQKPNLLFLPNLREDRRWDGGGLGASHTLGWRSLPLACGTREWRQLAHLLTLRFCLWVPLDRKKLKDGSLFLETYCKSPPSSSQDREDPGALPVTLPNRGIPAGGLLHLHSRLQSDVWVVYLGLRVHSSS